MGYIFRILEMYRYNLISQDYLVHHGVKGMKWGVRHDPQPTGRRRSSGSSASTKRRKSNAKKWLKRGMIVAAAGLAVYGGYKLYQSGQFDKLVSLGKNAIRKDNPVLGNPDLSTKTGKDGLEYIKDFNPNFDPAASNCRQATSEFLCKKSGIDCTAKSAEVVNGVVKSGANPHDLFPDSLVNNEPIPKKSLTSEKDFNSYLEKRFKELCGDKDGFGSLTINLYERPDGTYMRHNLSWEVSNGKFNVIDADGAINRSYYSTVKNNVDNGFSKGRVIEFFRAEGEIDLQAVEDQVIRR